jgi:hypothetical protein
MLILTGKRVPTALVAQAARLIFKLSSRLREVCPEGKHSGARQGLWEKPENSTKSGLGMELSGC